MAKQNGWREIAEGHYDTMVKDGKLKVIRESLSGRTGISVDIILHNKSGADIANAEYASGDAECDEDFTLEGGTEAEAARKLLAYRELFEDESLPEEVRGSLRNVVSLLEEKARK